MNEVENRLCTRNEALRYTRNDKRINIKLKK